MDSSHSRDNEETLIRRYLQLDEGDSFITKSHFIRLTCCSGLPAQDLEIIFDALDTDADGVILLDNLIGPSQQRHNHIGEIDSSAESIESAQSSSSFETGSDTSQIFNHCAGHDTFDVISNNISSYQISDQKMNFNGFTSAILIKPPEILIDQKLDLHDQPEAINAAFASYSSIRLEKSSTNEMNPHANNNNNDNKDNDIMTSLSRDTSVNVLVSGDYHDAGHLKDSDGKCPEVSTKSSNMTCPEYNRHKEHDDTYGSFALGVSQTESGIANSSENGDGNRKALLTSGQSIDSTAYHGANIKHPNEKNKVSTIDSTNLDLENFVSNNSTSMCDSFTNEDTTKETLQIIPTSHTAHDDSLSSQRDNHSIRPVHSYSRFKGERICSVISEPESNATNPAIKISVSANHRNDSNSNSQTTNSSNNNNNNHNIIKNKPKELIWNETPISRTLASPETVYEYDTSKIFGAAPSNRKLRHTPRRQESLNKRKTLPAVQTARQDVPADLDIFSKMSQEQVCELYQNLHGVDNPELVSQFENILLNVIKDVRQYKTENERLEKTYRKEKDEHDKHLHRMEEEMELQVQSVEERVRKQEKEKLESEKIDLRIQLDSEISMLQQNLKKLQQDGSNRMEKNQEDHLMAMKKRLEEIHMENRSLKSDLTDAQTNLALVKTEMSTVRQQLGEKAYELEVENKTLEAYENEQDKLRRQLQLLHEANKNLLDTNDNLREIIDTPNGAPSFIRTTSTDLNLLSLYKSGASARSASPNYQRKGSVMSEYVDKLSPGNRPLLEPSFQEEVSMMPRFLGNQYHCDPYEEDSIAEELDSGHSTLRDINDANDDTEIDSVSLHSDHRRSKRHRRHRSNLRVQVEEDPESHDEMDTDGETPMSPDSDILNRSDHRRSASVGSRGSNRSHRSITREESVMSQSSRSSRGSMRRQLPAIPKLVLPTPSTAPREPDRMYKIALAGDAAVGKSSFIVRLCKGKFVANLSSTLGVDFQTKMLEFDGNTTALQLWDTAGQERFRSIARTYFRRADGVLLLYDVTYERSFLNLRDWVETIEDGAVKKVPIMLVGNKTDVRYELEQQGKRTVKYEDGLKLAKELDALFIETSAKEGDNIAEAVIELTRMLRTNEDLEVQTVGMQLHEVKDKRKTPCCKFS